MNFENIDWADSDLESVNIEFDRAIITIWNDTLQTRLLVTCTGFAGITNLCMWDDTIIMDANIFVVATPNNEFLCDLYKSYNSDFDYGGRTLKDGLLELRIKLVNNISFSVYCLKIDVEDRE